MSISERKFISEPDKVGGKVFLLPAVFVFDNMLCGVSSLFLRILCLLDLKGLLKCYHMLSLYTAVTNLM